MSADVSAPITEPPPRRVPEHGRGLLVPAWQPGQSGNPGGRSREMQEAWRLAKQAAVPAMRGMLQLAGLASDPVTGKQLAASDDPRVQFMALKYILDKVIPDGTSPSSDDRAMPDLSALSPEQHRALGAALATVRGIVAGARQVEAEKE